MIRTKYANWTHNPYGNTHRKDVVVANDGKPVHIALYIRPSYDLKKEFGYMNGPLVGYRWQVYRIGSDERATLLHMEVVNDSTEKGLAKAKAQAETHLTNNMF